MAVCSSGSGHGTGDQGAWVLILQMPQLTLGKLQALLLRFSPLIILYKGLGRLSECLKNALRLSDERLLVQKYTTVRSAVTDWSLSC